MIRLTVETDDGKSIIEENTSEHDIDEMCELFERLLQSMSYSLRAGWHILYVPDNEESVDV